MIPEWIKVIWPAIVGISAGVIAMAAFTQQLLTIIKLRLEIRKLAKEHSEDRKTKPSLPAPVRHFQSLNRRRPDRATIHLIPVLKAALLSVFIGMSGISYVWLKGQNHALGSVIKAKENQLVLLKDHNSLMRWVLADIEYRKQSQTNAVPSRP